MPEAVIVSAVRTPVGRAPKGALSTVRPDDLAAIALNGALNRVPGLSKAEVDDVILGCAQPEGEAGWNLARMVALRAGLPVEVGQAVGAALGDGEKITKDGPVPPSPHFWDAAASEGMP